MQLTSHLLRVHGFRPLDLGPAPKASEGRQGRVVSDRLRPISRQDRRSGDQPQETLLCGAAEKF